MVLTRIGLKLPIEHYKHLKKLADRKFEGNLSALLRYHLPKQPKTILEEYQ